jgi:hypothetical protein
MGGCARELYWPDDKHELIDAESRTSVDQDSDTWWGDIYARQYQLKQNQYTRVTTTTTTRQFERFEAALEGYDVEVGVRLPYLPAWLEARVFGGYYAFEGDFTEDIDGFKGRLEVRALPALVFDAEVYENDELTGSDYFIGARVDLPFDVGNLARGKNPFEGIGGSVKPTKRELRDRLSDMVMRDPHVRIHESGWIENEDLLQVDRESDTSSRSFVVLDDVNFVNNGNQTGLENGSAENPWNTVQEGVNAVFGRNNVYVFQGVAPYRENVKITKDGVQLLGEGCAIAGFGGETFGGDKYPVLDGNVGGVNGPVIRVQADDVLIRGFEITRTPGGSNPGNVDDLFGSFTIDQVGILAENADNLTIECNRIHNHLRGIMSLYDGSAPGAPAQHNLQVFDNEIHDIDDTGIYLFGTGAGTYAATIRGNTIREVSTGVQAQMTTPNNVDLLIEQNDIFNVSSVGIYLNGLSASNNLAARVLDNRLDATTPLLFFAGPVGNDLWVDVSGNTSLQGAFTLFMPTVGGDAFVFVDDNQMPLGGAISLFMQPVSGNLVASLSGNEINGGGISYFASVVGSNHDLWMDDNVLSGGSLNAFMSVVGIDLSASMSGNRIQGGNLSFFGNAVGRDLELWMDDNVVLDAPGGGINAFLNPVGRDVYASFSGNTILNASGGGLSVFSLTAGRDAEVEISDNRVLGNLGSGISYFGGAVGGELLFIADRNQSDNNNGIGFFLNIPAVGGDAAVYIRDSSFDNNAQGLNATVTGVGGDLELVIDPTTANNNVGPGMIVTALAQSNVTVLLEDVTASGNGGPGIIVTANSITSSVQVAFLDVEANNNSGDGIIANLSAYEEALLGSFDISTSTVEGNRIAANNNGGNGFIATATSATGTVVHFSDELIATNNTANGIILTLAATENAFSFIDRAVANNNGANGFIQTLSAETVFFDIGQGQFNGNANAGLIATLSAFETAGVFLGQDANFMFPMEGRDVGLIEASDNGASGIQIAIASGGMGLLVADELEASRNGGSGILASVAADEDVIMVLGSRISNFTNVMVSEVRADDNAAGGIILAGASTTGSVDVAIGGGSASRNGGQGVSIGLSGYEDVSLMMGGSLFETLGAVNDFAPFVANGNGANGIIATLSSSEGSAVMGFLGGGASSNAGAGMIAVLSGADGMTGILGDVIPGSGATPLAFNDNTGAGLIFTGIAGGDTATVVIGGLEANRNGGSGMTFTLSAAEELSFIGGISGIMGDLETRRIQANDNGGDGFMYSGSSGSNQTFYASWLEANGNAADGAVIALSAGTGDIEFGLGNLLGLGPSIQGPQGLFASSNGNNGAVITLVSGAGDIDLFSGEIAVNDNAAAGMLLTAVTGSGEINARLGFGVSGTNAVVAPIAANNNGGLGLAATLVSGNSNISFAMTGLVATNNAGGPGLALTASAGAGDILIELGSDSLFGLEGEIIASHNAGDGLAVTASSGDGAVDISLNNITAISNANNGVTAVAATPGAASIALDDMNASGNGDYGVSATALAAASNATITANNLVLNDNATTGGLFYAAGGVDARVTVTNFTANNNGGTGLMIDASGANSATVIVSNATANNNAQGFNINSQSSAGQAYLRLENVTANANTGIGLDGDVTSAAGTSRILGENLAADDNGPYGIRLEAWGSNTADARIAIQGDLSADNNQTGALFAARSGQLSTVQLLLTFNVSATNNVNHGIVGAAEGTAASVSLDSGFFPLVNDNGGYGVVALAVGTNTTFANAMNPSGTGNGAGNEFEDTASVAPWEALLP